MKKLENLKKSLESLSKIYDYHEPYGEVELAGIVALFEISFELSWKAMKEALEDHGFGAAQTGSPKSILKTAYQAHMIDNEDTWLTALATRNEISHSYNQEIALSIVQAIKGTYYKMLTDLASKLQNEWSD